MAGPLTLEPGKHLRIRVLLDRSIAEVFVQDGRLCLTRRIYPTRGDSLGVRLLAQGGAAMAVRIDAWPMRSAR